MSPRYTTKFERPIQDLSKPNSPAKPPVRLPPKNRFDFKDYALPCFALATGAMVGLSAPQLIEPVGWSGWLKIGVFTAGAGLVSYVVNRHAVEDGAELASRGFLWAGFVSVSSVLIVGGGLFASTYAGLTIDRVNDLKLQKNGQALAVYIENVHSGAARLSSIAPPLQAAASDIDLHLACELDESCLSGRGNGGRGRVTRALEPVAKRAHEIAAQIAQSGETRNVSLTRINRLVGNYQLVAGDEALSRKDKRQKLSRHDSEIKQEAASLKELLPVSMVKAYADELSKGLSIDGRPEATRNVSALLGRHGAALSASLDAMPEAKSTAPSFPDKAGVSATFSYIGHFIPIAALTAVIELIMPLTLWVYVLLGHVWRHYRDDPPSPSNRSAPPPIASHGGHNVH